VSYGATSIELWRDYKGFPTVPNDKLKRWAKMVEATTRPDARRAQRPLARSTIHTTATPATANEPKRNTSV
jgi:hypothetical protein